MRECRRGFPTQTIQPFLSMFYCYGSNRVSGVRSRSNNSPDHDAEMHALEKAMFYFPKTSASTLKDLSIVNNFGYPVSVDEGSLTISGDSLFFNNTGEVGAVIVASGSIVSMTGVEFKGNRYGSPGGCLDLRDGSSAVINSSSFYNNAANVASAILATSLKRLQIRDSYFEQDCYPCGGLILVNRSADATSAINISNSHFDTFNRFDAKKGVVQDQPQGLLVIDRFHNGHVLLESVDFGKPRVFDASHNESSDIGMVVLDNTHNVTFTSRNSWYIGAGNALGSGLRFVDSSGQFRVEKAVFYRLTCYDMGHAIFLRISPCDPMAAKLIVVDSQFSSNIIYGMTVFVTGSNVDVVVRGSQFIDNWVSNYVADNFPAASILYVSDINFLYVSDCTALYNTASDGMNTEAVLGSLHIDRTKIAKIERSNFTANTVGTRRGSVGGAVYYSSPGDMGSILEVTDCRFENNTASGGGAIYAKGLRRLKMTRCSFRNNIANFSGGAVLTFIDSGYVNAAHSTFVDNRARIGGAMAVGIIKTRLIIEGCTFSTNKAELYGGAIALIHIPIKLTIIWEDRFAFRLFSVTFLRNTATFGGKPSLIIIR